MNQLEGRRGLDHLSIAPPQSQGEWAEASVERGAKREPEAIEFTVYTRTGSTRSAPSACFRSSTPTAEPSSGSPSASAALRARHRGHALMLDFAFHVLQLDNVLLETRDWNGPGLAAYVRAGSRCIGVRRATAMSRGRPTDIVLMDAIPQHFGVSTLR